MAQRTAVAATTLPFRSKHPVTGGAAAVSRRYGVRSGVATPFWLQVFDESFQRRKNVTIKQKEVDDDEDEVCPHRYPDGWCPRPLST